jgi:hypothetical protein
LASPKLFIPLFFCTGPTTSNATRISGLEQIQNLFAKFVPSTIRDPANFDRWLLSANLSKANDG